jgi:hypothetical protein
MGWGKVAKAVRIGELEFFDSEVNGEDSKEVVEGLSGCGAEHSPNTLKCVILGNM